MPKKATEAQTVQFSITLPTQVVDMIEQLIPIGLYGASRGEVARVLISARLEQLVSSGIVKLAKPGP